MASRKKTFNIILIILIAVFIIAQFFGPEENTYQQVPDTDIAKVENVPAEVMSILKTSCYDCHSNNTSYPWYDKITLVNYYLAEHVEDGKKHLNFSEWGKLSHQKKQHALKEILEEVAAKEMPLKSYLLLHQDANLSLAEVKTLKNWINKALEND